MRQKVLFICTHNSARSLMCESLLRQLAGDRFETYSAGTNVSTVNPYVIEVLDKEGIDTSSLYSKSINKFRSNKFDLVVTVCDHAKETCPFFPGAKKYVHKSFKDPSKFTGTDEEILDAVRQVKQTIKEWIQEFFIEEVEDHTSNTIFFVP